MRSALCIVFMRVFLAASRGANKKKTKFVCAMISTSVAVSDLNSHRKGEGGREKKGSNNYQRCYVYIIIFGKTYYRIYSRDAIHHRV